MLKITDVKLELFSDRDKYLFIEQELKGGISYICKKFNEENNMWKQYMKNSDPTKASKFLIYLDPKKIIWLGSDLPYGKFRWLKNIDSFDVNSIEENNPIGYILEVNLEYCDELHEMHNDHSLAPKKLAIPCDTLSN